MHVGICKLCLKERELQESHFMPAALYPRKKKLQFLTSKGVAILKGQMKAPLLCRKCEMRFDQNGESEVLRWLAPKMTKRWPLNEKLRLALPREDYGEFSRFAGNDVGLEMEKFAYFAVSIAWRMTIHDWVMPNGIELPRYELGDFAKDMRRYLLGETAFPSDMAVIVIVCSDEETRKVWLVPDVFVEANCLNIAFVTRGIRFRLMMGYQMPEYFRDMSCTSPRKCLLYGNAKHRMQELHKRFDQETKAPGNVEQPPKFLVRRQ